MKEKNWKLSVIIPVYNAEKVISNCVQSILTQDYDNIDLLLINDGSTDQSGIICEQFAQQDPRIRVVHQKNQGVSAARNHGIQLAKGDFLFFIDADDQIEKNFFHSISPFLADNDMICWGSHNISPRGKHLGNYILPTMDTTKHTIADIIYTLIQTGIFGYVWSFCIKKDLIKQHHISFREDFTLHEDFLFSCDILMHVTHICTLNKQLYHYIINEKGKSLRSKIPDNCIEIALTRISKAEKLFTIVQMENRKREKILSFWKYSFYSGCMEWACSRPNKIKSIKSVFNKLSKLENFNVPLSLKTVITQLAIRTKNPYLILCGKYFSGKFLPQKDSVTLQ